MILYPREAHRQALSVLWSTPGLDQDAYYLLPSSPLLKPLLYCSVIPKVQPAYPLVCFTSLPSCVLKPSGQDSPRLDSENGSSCSSLLLTLGKCLCMVSLKYIHCGLTQTRHWAKGNMLFSRQPWGVSANIPPALQLGNRGSERERDSPEVF